MTKMEDSEENSKDAVVAVWMDIAWNVLHKIKISYMHCQSNIPTTISSTIELKMFKMRWSGYAGLVSSVVSLRFTGNICQTEEYFSYYIDMAWRWRLTVQYFLHIMLIHLGSSWRIRWPLFNFSFVAVFCTLVVSKCILKTLLTSQGLLLFIFSVPSPHFFSFFL